MEHFEFLDFADDIAMLSTWHSYMQSKINDVNAGSTRAGLKINSDKTRAMAINAVLPANFVVDGQPSESVSAYQYLGSNIAPDGSAKDDVCSKITKARAAFASLKKV